MEEESRFNSKTSRRDALKKIGAGSALIWSAPAISSLGRAMAQEGGSPVPPTRCAEGQFNCTDPFVAPTFCGSSNCPLSSCICDTNTEGGTFCWNDQFCANIESCNASSDCPDGHQCFENTCCGAQGVCLPDCGVCVGQNADTNQTGPTASGR